MQQFIVPQFIDVETKIIGPITVRQFLILLVTGIIIFLVYKLADFSLFVFLGLVLFAIGGTFAFFKVNGQPFHYFLLNLIQTLKKPKIRIWDKKLFSEELKYYMRTEEKKVIISHPLKTPLAATRLAELALIVNTGGVYQGENYE